MGRRCRHQPTARRIITIGDDSFEGPDYRGWHETQGVCEYGNCVELNCPVCGCARGGWGPVGCPCQDWIGYRDMRAERPAAVKPSLAARTQRRRRTRSLR